MQAVTLVSEAEVNLFRRFRSKGAIQAIPNGVDLEYFSPIFTDYPSPITPHRLPLSCVFVGALDYRPNVDGACWFCTEVWPEILKRRPQATMRLVGRRPAAAVRRLAVQPGVELVGQVPDVRPYLANSSVVVAPLRLARGLQNKVLEALAMGKAVVASPESLKGIGAIAGEHLLAAKSPDEWVDAIEQLFDNAALRAQLGSAGRRYVETHHDWDRCLEPFAALLSLHRKPITLSSSPPSPLPPLRGDRGRGEGDSLVLDRSGDRS
jgi:sugar transferase (PEP-CTERM/EpsH1 system associated)